MPPSHGPLLRTPAPLVGIGLRAPHYKQVVDSPPNSIGWMEVHPENYFGGGFHKEMLRKVRANTDISFHGVGLSLGSDQPVDENHLKNLKELIQEFDPFVVSDHASWSRSGNAHMNDLLPLPYTTETLNRLADNVSRTQDYLGRAMLVENPSTYLSFAQDEMSEPDFLNRLTEKTGCSLLLDINNIFVQAHNHNFDAEQYLDAINPTYVKEIHLAGHIEQSHGDASLLIDTHSKPVRKDVWDLYEKAAQLFGPTLTLIEWDADIPPLEVLLEEAARAESIQTTINRSGQERLQRAAL